MSTSDIAIQAIMKQTGVNLRLVYFEGDAKSFPALMGGHVATIFASTGTLVGPVKSGHGPGDCPNGKRHVAVLSWCGDSDVSGFQCKLGLNPGVDRAGRHAQGGYRRLRAGSRRRRLRIRSSSSGWTTRRRPWCFIVANSTRRPSKNSTSGSSRSSKSSGSSSKKRRSRE